MRSRTVCIEKKVLARILVCQRRFLYVHDAKVRLEAGWRVIPFEAGWWLANLRSDCNTKKRAERKWLYPR
jgi:hypothetical protein